MALQWKDETHWSASWADGLDFKYAKWKDGEPNNYDEIEDCVTMYADNEWVDYPCTTLPQRYVCKKLIKPSTLLCERD